MFDNIVLALRNIKERKLRSFLTLLGIAIGIMAIVSLMAVGTGMQHAVTGELSRMSDIIILMPGKMVPRRGYVGAGTFTDRDMSDINHVGGIKAVGPMMYDTVKVEHKRETSFIEVSGMHPRVMEKMFENRGVDLESGDYLRKGDRKKCVLGYVVANEYFDDVEVGDRLTIKGDRFVVKGIFEKQGQVMSDIDTQIQVTMENAKDLFGTKDINFAMIQVRDVSKVDEIADEIEAEINDNHGSDDYCTAMTMSSISKQINKVLSIIQVVLLAIASIALIVAAIGIMNTILTSVMERTREIGIMKAIGATNRNVMSIFLAESALISAIGGIIGCALGIIGARVITVGAAGFIGAEMEPVVTPEILLMGFGVAILVGVLSGLYPARRASRMSPVEAVRYE